MTVHVRANSPIAEIVLDRPKVNAFDVDQVERLSAGFEQLAAVDGLRAVLLRAAGDVAFSAGADLGATGPLAEPTGLARWTNAARAMLDGIASFPVPVVASLRKAAAGGGFELALPAARPPARETEEGKPLMFNYMQNKRKKFLFFNNFRLA